MEQQQIKVSWSVGTKLLVGGVVSLLLVIIFLNFSAIFLLKEDKRAYVYESQSTEAVLTGREFVNTARRVMDSLRLSLGTVDPLKPIGPSQEQSLRSIVANQSDAVSISLWSVDTKSATPKLMIASAAEKNTHSVPLTAELLQPVLADLKGASYVFLNLSKVGEGPLLGILVADSKAKGGDALPVALGLVSLDEFVKQLGGLNLTVATKSGRVLFDTDPTVLFSKKYVTDDPFFQAAVASQLSMGAQEYDTDNGRYLASYVKSGFDLVVISRMEWQKAMKATYALTEKFILLGLIAIAGAMVFTILFARRLTAPINRLYEATKEVASGNFNVDLKPRGKDEIAALTESFNVMSSQISELIQERMKKLQIENDLEIAATVQQTLIPPPVYRNDRILIHSHYQSAAECGGDWWGFFGVNNRLCLMIADATGHGLPSALITASARSCISVMHKLAQDDPAFSFSPQAMLAYANRVIYDASLGKIMMTFFVATIDFDQMTLTYASAGQTPPWLFKQEDGKVVAKSLMANGSRLGEVRDRDDFEEKTVSLAPGDLLFMYTDGLLEGTNQAGAMYGKKRARRLVEGAVAGGPEQIIRTVVADFGAYNNGKALDDDLTLAAIGILDPNASMAREPERLS